MKDYLQKDNAYREFLKTGEHLKAEREIAKDAIMEFFQNNGVEENVNMNTEEGVVMYRKTKTYGGITKKLLSENIDQFVRSKNIDIDIKDLINYVWSKREVNEKWDISRKMEED